MFLADGTYWKYDYDDLGQVVRGVKHWPDGAEIAGQNLTYVFDDIGNRKETGGRASAVSTYQPNELNQYAQRTVAGAIDVFGLADPQAAVQVNGATASRYGAYFHRVVSVDNSASAQYPTLTIQAGNNSAARHAFVPKNPEVLEYDDDGNLTQDGRWNYEWNGENRLTRMTARSDVPGPHYQLTFQYDWMGRRIRKTVVDTNTGQTISDLIFLYDGWNLIAEVDAQTGELIRTYVWGPDLSGAMQGAGGIGGLLWITHHEDHGITHHDSFAVYDGNGNVMGLVSASDGSVAAQYEYGPFAEPLRATGPLAADNPFRFSTKYTDSETGLIYYGYRYYDPSLGRWLSRDPVLETQQLVFIHNNPIGETDSIGLWGSDVHEGMTTLWAMQQGVSPSCARRIGKADAEIDEIFDTTKIFSDSVWAWHFNRSPTPGKDSRTVLARAMIRLAKKACSRRRDDPQAAAKYLGQALHALQDWVAHGDFNCRRLVPTLSVPLLQRPWYIHNNPWRGYFIDAPFTIDHVDDPNYDFAGPYGKATLGVMVPWKRFPNGNVIALSPAFPGSVRITWTRRVTKGVIGRFQIYVIRHSYPCGKCWGYFLGLIWNLPRGIIYSTIKIKELPVGDLGI